MVELFGVRKNGLVRSHTQFIKAGAVIAMLTMLQACQFQPLYSNDGGTLAGSSAALNSVSVAKVDTRPAQQVRNHLIFLMSGGSTPLNPSHEVRLRVNRTANVLASRVSDQSTGQIGNTAGSIDMSASFEIFDVVQKQVVYKGKRNASAAYDITSQTFAARRASRDAENRAAKELAEQLRLAIAAYFSANQ